MRYKQVAIGCGWRPVGRVAPRAPRAGAGIAARDAPYTQYPPTAL